MGMKVYHVTPSENAASIIAMGLIPMTFHNQENKNFPKCGNSIYVSNSEESARRWAGEIARETGKQDFTIFTFEPETSIYFVGTYLGVEQGQIWEAIPHDSLTVHAELTAEPIPNFLVPSMPGYLWCLGCETNVKDDEFIQSEHLANFHDEEEDEEAEDSLEANGKVAV